jgi:hypothetical protein
MCCALLLIWACEPTHINPSHHVRQCACVVGRFSLVNVIWNLKSTRSAEFSRPRNVEKIIKNIETNIFLKIYVHIYKNMNEITFKWGHVTGFATDGDDMNTGTHDGGKESDWEWLRVTILQQNHRGGRPKIKQRKNVERRLGQIAEGKPLVLLQVNCRSICNKILEF